MKTREQAQAAYASRNQVLCAESQRWQRWEGITSKSRLGVFLAGVVLAWLALVSQEISLFWPLAAAVVFLALLVFHEGVIRKHQRARRASQFYQRGLARLEDQWRGEGDAGEDYRDPRHLYSEDLDLFGVGSLFELLATVRTSAGRETLAGWLRAPAPPSTILRRQAAVEELRHNLDLREDLAILGEDVESRFLPSALVRWAGEAPTLPGARTAPALAACVAAATIVSLAGWILGSVPGFFPLAMIALELGLAIYWRKPVLATIQAVDRPVRDLEILRDLLRRFEEETFGSPHLAESMKALSSSDRTPSQQIARLSRLHHLLDARRNQFFAPLGALLLWGTQLSFAIEAWKRTHGPRVASWIHASGEIEALCALSCFAYENPEDVFAQIVSPDEGPLFEAEALGHPLLPVERSVRNDVRLDPKTRAWIVSGSNMSGKSTLLRSVGTNLVLAQAGAPVRARRLRMTPTSIGASIRVLDSLQDGTSRFYAEILRLKEVLDLARDGRGLIFLLDEILHGTNSHDRQRGAEAIIRSLLDRQAIGLVTTHDLALAKVADDPSLGVANVHFEDRIREGRIEFDYRLKPGIVRHSNALDLMRAAGLDV